MSAAPGQVHRSDDDGSAAALSDAAQRRLSNQIGRVYRGTYGASTGLRTVVTSVARQLLGAGASRAAVARAVEQCVLSHPARGDAESGKIAASEGSARTLVELTREWWDPLESTCRHASLSIL